MTAPADAADLSVAAAIVEVRATTANLPHLRALAARLIAARDAMGEPEPENQTTERKPLS